MEKEEIIAELKEKLGEINGIEYTHEKTIVYSDSMRTVLQRFISEFEKEDIPEEELIKMADIVAKIWSSRADKEVLVDELLNAPQRVPDTDTAGDHQDFTSEQLTEAYHIQSNMRTFHFLVQRMYHDYKIERAASRFWEPILAELPAKLDKDPKELSEMSLGDLLKLWGTYIDDLDGTEEFGDSEESDDDEFDDIEELYDEFADDEDFFREYVYGEFVFNYSIPHELFVRVEEWFGEQKELDEIMGR